jgi:hypothetical protein
MQIFRDCPRKYYWKFVENLEADRPAMNLEVGSATHEGLAHLGSGTDLPAAIIAAKERFRRDLPKRRLPGDDEMYAEGEELVEKLLIHYVEFWGDQGKMFRPLGNEVAGTVEVGEGTGIFLRFRTDKFVHAFGGLWIVDHKTAAKMDMREMMKYQMDLQMTAYIYGASKLLKTRVQGVIVDFLVKTKVPQFNREAFERTDAELREFEYNFTNWARAIQRCHFDLGYEGTTDKVYAVPDEMPWLAFPRDEKECFRFGTCLYRGLCMDPANIGLRAEFVRRKEDYVDNAVLLTEGQKP